jgi:hypothetical protein
MDNRYRAEESQQDFSTEVKKRIDIHAGRSPSIEARRRYETRLFEDYHRMAQIRYSLG